MRVGWNVWGSAFCTVSHLWRNCQPSFASNFHTLNANVPTFDDLTGAKSKLEGFAAETRVKYFAIVLELALVIHSNRFLAGCLGTISDLKIFNKIISSSVFRMVRPFDFYIVF